MQQNNTRRHDPGRTNQGKQKNTQYATNKKKQHTHTSPHTHTYKHIPRQTHTHKKKKRKNLTRKRRRKWGEIKIARQMNR